MMVGWINMKRDKIRIVLLRSSAEQILEEWNSHDNNGSIYVRKLVKLIERQMDKPAPKRVPRRSIDGKGET